MCPRAQWGGHYFLAGGGVKGGQVLGAYPDDLTGGGSKNIGRGRLIPTTSWEAIWQVLSQWFGVEGARMDSVLPNRSNFDDSQLLTQSDLF